MEGGEGEGTKEWGKKGPPLGNDSKNSSRNNSDEGNRRVSRMRHERSSQEWRWGKK